MPTFLDRQQAGNVLARHLMGYARRQNVVVLGVPRGGVPVAAEVARVLELPLDVFVVRKLGLPGFEDMAMGAIGPSGITLIEWGTVARFGVTGSAVASVVARERAELTRRETAYRGCATPVNLTDRTVILVDDGLTSGASIRAAAVAARERRPARVVVAMPICTPSIANDLREEVDEVECALTPETFRAANAWYRDSAPTSDEDVRGLLAESRRRSNVVPLRASSPPPS